MDEKDMADGKDIGGDKDLAGSKDIPSGDDIANSKEKDNFTEDQSKQESNLAQESDTVVVEQMDTEIGSAKPDTSTVQQSDLQAALTAAVAVSLPGISHATDVAGEDTQDQLSDDKQTSLSNELATEISSPPTSPPEPVDIKIIYNKRKFDHTADLNHTILDLKNDIEKLTGVPVATQKVMFKGSTNNEQTLKQLKVSKSANKFMVIGSTMDDLLKVSAPPDPKSAASGSDGKVASSSSKEPLCKQTVHKKVLDKYGKPEDVSPGMKGSPRPLPLTPLTGMYNKYGGKTRLTFKHEQDEVWIGTKERTQKVKMGSIKDITSQPITDHEEYHIMGLQLGTTEASKYWIYWVPAQYVNAIKDAILGKWGDF